MPRAVRGAARRGRARGGLRRRGQRGGRAQRGGARRAARAHAAADLEAERGRGRRARRARAARGPLRARARAAPRAHGLRRHRQPARGRALAVGDEAEAPSSSLSGNLHAADLARQYACGALDLVELRALAAALARVAWARDADGRKAEWAAAVRARLAEAEAAAARGELAPRRRRDAAYEGTEGLRPFGDGSEAEHARAARRRSVGTRAAESLAAPEHRARAAPARLSRRDDAHMVEVLGSLRALTDPARPYTRARRPSEGEVGRLGDEKLEPVRSLFERARGGGGGGGGGERASAPRVDPGAVLTKVDSSKLAALLARRNAPASEDPSPRAPAPEPEPAPAPAPSAARGDGRDVAHRLMEVAAARLLDHVSRLPAAEYGAPAAGAAPASREARSARAERDALELASPLRSKGSDPSLVDPDGSAGADKSSAGLIGSYSSTTETSSEGQYHDATDEGFAEPWSPSPDDHEALARALEDAEAHLEELRGELREAHVERRRMLRDAVALISEIIGAGA